jgi:hypothetical protein
MSIGIGPPVVDLAYSLAAVAILAVGALASRACLREERHGRRRPSDLRHRQLDREVDESGPITWRR